MGFINHGFIGNLIVLNNGSSNFISSSIFLICYPKQDSKIHQTIPLKLLMKTNINNKHCFYLALTVLGGGLTFYFVMLGIIEHKGEFDSMEFISSTWIDSYYAKSLTFDFWTGTIAGTFFILVEGIRLKMKRFDHPCLCL